jgi:uncharacterized membrane protein
MALGLLSMASLIFFIHDIAQSIRASVIVKRLTVDARAIAGRAFPREFGAPLPDSVDAADDQPREGERWIVAADAPGYLATMDEDILFGHDSGEAFTVRMAVCIGEFVRTGDAIAEISAAAAPDRRRIEGAVRGAFRLAAEPSGPQDIGVAVSRLTDVAVRALSPSSNDAATAAACVDGLSEVFVALGRRLPPDAVRASPDGRVRLVAKHPSFEELLDVTFAPLRHHGAGDPMIAMKLLDVALALGERVHESRRALFVREAELVLRAASQAIANEDQRARVRGRAEVVLTRLGGQIRS